LQGDDEIDGGTSRQEAREGDSSSEPDGTEWDGPEDDYDVPPHVGMSESVAGLGINWALLKTSVISRADLIPSSDMADEIDISSRQSRMDTDPDSPRSLIIGYVTLHQIVLTIGHIVLYPIQEYRHRPQYTMHVG
jgi:hypothetical protein